ncbi:hypothetical protein B9Z55_014807 [Caenorhabditis nigoni]|uniref:CCHC-type domain-containing protein n=1 Tax=Caenorhabditis nigoni TaxID=1611254 RepID=A0A2G5U7G2_9PELO|nr:hypothetical protein B9Z55_014807 [Caenorhabditis nigoni]
MVFPELPTQVQECVKSKQFQVMESKVSVEVIPDERSKNSFVAKRMNTNITSSSQFADSSGNKTISSTTEEASVVHPIGEGGEMQRVQDGGTSQFESDQLGRNKEDQEVLQVKGTVKTSREGVPGREKFSEIAGGENERGCTRHTENGLYAVVPIGQTGHRGDSSELTSKHCSENVGDGTPSEFSDKLVSGDGHQTIDDNGSDQAQQGQMSSSPSLGVAGEGSRAKHSTPPGSGDGDKVKLLKASELEQIAILTMKEFSRKEVKVRPHCNQGFQNFSDSVWSCDGACSFKDVSTDEDRTVLFLALSVKEARDCADEAQKELIIGTVRNLIEQCTQRVVNAGDTKSFKEDIQMLMNTNTNELSSNSNQNEESLEEASRGESFSTPGLQAHQAASSSIFMPPEQLSSLDRSADNSIQSRQEQEWSSTNKGNNSIQCQNNARGRGLGNQAVNEDSYPVGQNSYQNNSSQERQQAEQSKEQPKQSWHMWRYRDQLRSIKKEDDESVNDFFSRVSEVASKAYIDTDSAYAKDNIMYSFLLGLPMDMRIAVQSKDLTTVEEFLEEACKFEYFSTPNFQTQQTTSMKVRNEWWPILNRLNDLLNQVSQRDGNFNQSSPNQQPTNGQRSSNQVGWKAQQPRRTKVVTCFSCGTQGHYANRCSVKASNKLFEAFEKEIRKREKRTEILMQRHEELTAATLAATQKQSKGSSEADQVKPHERYRSSYKENENTDGQWSCFDEAAPTRSCTDNHSIEITPRRPRVTSSSNRQLPLEKVEKGTQDNTFTSNSRFARSNEHLQELNKGHESVAGKKPHVSEADELVDVIKAMPKMIPHHEDDEGAWKTATRFTEHEEETSTNTYEQLIPRSKIFRQTGLCHFCDQFGHMVEQCPFYNAEEATRRTVLEKVPISSSIPSKETLPVTPIMVNGERYRGLVNTGPSFIFTGVNMSQRLKIKPTSTLVTPQVIVLEHGHMDIVASAWITLTVGSFTTEHKLHFTADPCTTEDYEFILGSEFISRMLRAERNCGEGQMEERMPSPITSSTNLDTLQGNFKKSQNQAERKTDGTTRHVQVKHNIRGYLRRTRSTACSTGTIPRSEKKN